MSALLDRCGPFDIGPGPEWYREIADWASEPEPTAEVIIAARCDGCGYLATRCACPGGTRWAA